MDPIGSSEQGYGGTKHWPRADPDCDAKGKNNEAEVHGIAGKLIRAACNKLTIGWRSGSTSVPSRRKSTMAQTGRIHEVATNKIPKGASGRPGTLDQPKNQPNAAAVRT